LQGSLRQRGRELRVELLENGLDIDLHGSYLDVRIGQARLQLIIALSHALRVTELRPLIS
jgi:hypothetical protein